MAGDWIKMRGNLWDDPRVAKVCDMTSQSEAAVIGALYWLWSTADQHTEDGIMRGMSLRAIDRKTGVQGFGQAVCDVGWLADDPEGVRIVRFEEHNGTSAKKRAVTANRVARHRSGNAETGEVDDDVTQSALPKEDASVTGALARERERVREEDIHRSTTKMVGAAEPQKPPNPRSPVGSRIPPEFPTPHEIEFCQQERPDLHAATVAASFRDYWSAVPGAKGRKLDWPATWRNWVRGQKREYRPQQARASPAADRNAAFMRKLAESSYPSEVVIDVESTVPRLG